MQPRQSYGVGEFRQNATEIIRAVEASATPVQVTRHGKPVVELRPIASDDAGLLGSVAIAEGTDLTLPVVDDTNWSATS